MTAEAPSKPDTVRFSAACARALLRKKEEGGIGMLGEKSLHSALKYYFEPDESRHEALVSGFFADILNEEGIIEIQTKNLYALKRKLKEYLKEYRVIVAHPVIREKRLIYLDPDTGELSKPRLSPKKGKLTDAFRELMYIREYLKEPGLTIALVLVDAEEYRVREAGRRKRRGGAADLKYELLPTALIEEVRLKPKELIRFLPSELKENGARFTVKALQKASGLNYSTAWAMCAVLVSVGALSRSREGRSYVYYCTEEPK
ncbi:MAG: hypothetical protein IJM18_05225 [Clostridia bacterium]|nr:hypothetical protein [Clostridia bacterium]